jgi:two-component system, chemotaxis family, chemotaxis protein CheY
MDEDCRNGVAIIEDEVDLVKIYIRLFQKRGIPVAFVAYDGMEAIQIFSRMKTRPTVILMDNRMPAMGGIDTAKEIMKIEPKSKIIFMSADVGVKEEAMAAGAIAFLQKPASIDTITKTVRMAMD